MNALELAEIQAFKTEELTMWERNHTATMLRQQQAEIEAYKNLVKAQDEKIVELAFRAVYAERGNEVVKELNNEQ